MTEPAPDLRKDWLIRSGGFRTVVGYAEATDLLSDRRMHADFMSGSLLSMNGEDHKRYRALIADRFTPRAVNAIRPVARDAAQELINVFALAGRCEFISDFAVKYVTICTCAYLWFSLDEVLALAPALESFVGLVDYTTRALADRHRHTPNGVLSTVAQAVSRGDLPEPMAAELVAGLLAAGHIPTINQLGIMVDVLSREPDIWEALGQGELEVAPVVEEVLRFRSTNQGMNRRVAESFEYRGVHLVKGEQILIGLAAVNRDPRRFANGDSFELEANARAHLAFGFGPHFCLGAALARTQLQEALRALTSRVTCPQVVRSVERIGIGDRNDSSEPVGKGGLAGPSSLEITFTAAEPERPQ